jgi:hypothetical protein
MHSLKGWIYATLGSDHLQLQPPVSHWEFEPHATPAVGFLSVQTHCLHFKLLMTSYSGPTPRSALKIELFTSAALLTNYPYSDKHCLGVIEQIRLGDFIPVEPGDNGK